MLQHHTPNKAVSILAHRFVLPLSLVALALSSSGQTYTTVGNPGSQSLAGSGPNPFVAADNTSRGTRQQYIVRGQELLDAGIPANAQIVSVGFNITQAASNGGNVQNLSNWQVALFSNTSLANTSPLGSWVSAPVVASSVPATITVGTTGWKHTEFTTPYVWPGGATSNLVVQVCYNNASTNGNNTNTHARVQRTTNLSTTVGVRSRWLIGSATSGICENTASFATTSDLLRPMVQIGWILGPTPGNTLASVNPVVCGTTTLSMEVPGTGADYQWQSSTDNVGYTDLVGATSATYNAAPAATTWYRCMATANGITVNSTPIQVIVNAPQPGSTTGPTNTFCIPAILGIQNSQPMGVDYLWEASTTGDVGTNYTPTGGTMAIYSAAVAVPTWYRCRVSCPGTGLFTYSTALLVTPDEPDAGSSAATTLCFNAPPIDLLATLGGTPDPGGAWSGPSSVVNGLFDPATMIGGVYTYTVPGTAPCLDATATVSVVLDPCLGIREEANAAAFLWMGQQPDGTHAIRSAGSSVLGWHVFDAAGRTVGSSSTPVQGELVHIPLSMERSGFYVVQLIAADGMTTLRVAHVN